jgi:hypothetical protein
MSSTNLETDTIEADIKAKCDDLDRELEETRNIEGEKNVAFYAKRCVVPPKKNSGT